MIHYAPTQKDNDEFKWVGVENLELHAQNRQKGAAVYLIEDLADGALMDQLEPSYDAALAYIKERFGVDKSALKSTKEMVAAGHDMSNFLDLDFKT
jgi:hypothetical protein